jgi:hypothetical protein
MGCACGKCPPNRLKGQGSKYKHLNGKSNGAANGADHHAKIHATHHALAQHGGNGRKPANGAGRG